MSVAEPKCIVYQALNTKNGKRYIGATVKGLRARRSRHFTCARRGNPGKFYTAIRTHGREAFFFSVLLECQDFMCALEEERRLIAELKPEYNITGGGGGVFGHTPSAETRKKMSISAKKRWGVLRSPEEEEALRQYKFSRLQRKGKKITDPELLEQRRECFKKAVEAIKRRVRCITHDLSFESCRAAAKHYGISTASIVLYCQKKAQPKSGLVFEYVSAAHV